jgi:putative N6-adenine-specific DNA methylase
MSGFQPTQRRIKRHVIAKTHTFFAVTPPGIESLCANEIKALPADVPQIKVRPGGVEFKGRLTVCYVANLYLRTPSRILMRLAEFKATNFRQFETKTFQVPWELYLPPSVERITRVKSMHSRLVHTDAISEHLEKAILQRMPSTATNKPIQATQLNRQRIFVRIIKDRVVISLDSSGSLLYKRGLKQDVGQAPIRETLAAAILKLAGYDGSQVVLDPMCGSGSFSLEAAMIAQNIPAGEYRHFAFMSWPAFREPHWCHLKKTAIKQFRPVPAATVFASDLDKNRLEILKKIIQQSNLSETIHVACQDFFTLNPQKITDKPGILVLNPPYGVRLRTPIKPKQFYENIRQKLLSEYCGWQVALLVKNQAVNRQFPKKLQRIAINHGGIDLELIYGVIKT